MCVWPRLSKIAVRVGALVLLFYSASFFTRDWRPFVLNAAQPWREPVTSWQTPPRPITAPLIQPRTLSRSSPSELPSVADTMANPPTSTAPHLQAQPVAPPSRVPRKRKQPAGPSIVKSPSPVSHPQLLEAPVEFQLAERGN